jgi:hypothetical protein
MWTTSSLQCETFFANPELLLRRITLGMVRRAKPARPLAKPWNLGQHNQCSCRAQESGEQIRHCRRRSREPCRSGQLPRSSLISNDHDFPSCLDLRGVLRPDGRLFIFMPRFEILGTSLDDQLGHMCRFTCLSHFQQFKEAITSRPKVYP